MRSLRIFCNQGCEWVLYLADDSPPSTLVTASQLPSCRQGAGDLSGVRLDERAGERARVLRGGRYWETGMRERERWGRMGLQIRRSLRRGSGPAEKFWDRRLAQSHSKKIK